MKKIFSFHDFRIAKALKCHTKDFLKINVKQKI